MHFGKAATGLFVCTLLVAACTTEPLEEGEHDLVLTIGDLRPYGLTLPTGFAAYETFTRERWFDGSVTIEYEFEAPDELALPYLYSAAERHPSKSDACLSFSAGNIGVQLGGAEITERNDLFDYGDKSRFGLLTFEGEPRGNAFSMCRDKTAFMVLLAGFYFDDGEVWEEVVAPALSELHAWQ